jgi:protein-tyrosine phosphatase
MGSGAVRTFKSIYESEAPFAEVERILRAVFEDVLSSFSRAALYERLPLLEYYGFSSRWADSVRTRVAAVMSCPPQTAHLDFGHGYTARNVADFYEHDLDALPQSFGESHFVAYVHGDLNGANILVDMRDNIWLIDFFHAHRGHIIKDVAKLESDLLYIFTPVETDADMAEALAITRALRSVRDLAAPLPALPRLARPQMVRAWATLRLLRGFAATLCKSDRDPNQLRVALLRYGVHTLSFDESSPLQKRWALATACAWAEDIKRHAEASTALRVDWVDAPRLVDGGGQLGLTICPGRRDRDRDLDRDLDTLVEAGVTTLVSLLPDHELEWAGVIELLASAKARGLRVIRQPIPDQGVGSQREIAQTVAQIRARLRADEKVVVHCMGGLGRSGLVCAAVLVSAGATAADAVAHVRAARGPRAVETASQYAFVERFEASRTP